MCAKFGMSINSYASRRAGANLLTVINAEDVIRTAFGNWKASKSMPDLYTETKEMVSAERFICSLSYPLKVGNEN